MKLLTALALLACFVLRPPAAEVKADVLLALYAKIQESDDQAVLPLLQIAPEAPPEYVARKLPGFRSFSFITATNLRGILHGKKLVALAIEEKPGDLDPVIFVRDGDHFRLLINLTRLRDSGLEKDPVCVQEMAEIDVWLTKLKGR